MVDFKDYTYKMDRTLEVLQEDFGAVRAGRANARVLDRISVVALFATRRFLSGRPEGGKDDRISTEIEE